MSPARRCVQKSRPKFQGNPKEAHEKNQNRCAIAFGFGARAEKLGFFSKNNWVFLTWDIPRTGGSAPKHFATPVGTGEALIVFWEVFLKIGRKN